MEFPSCRPRQRAAAHARALVAAIALALLSGCGLFGSSSAKDEKSAATCPAAAILRPLAQTAVFAPGAKPQPMGVAFYGVLSEVNAQCERAGDAVRASLDVVVVGERGAAAKGDAVDLQYFVAVTGADQSILSKRSFPVQITIPPGTRRAGVTDHIEETIPLGGRPASELNIVLGFQQGPEVVEFYKQFRGR
ncbi:MAG TPA: hypothetical protein VF007_03240 [Stellaceae bacterium]